MSNYIGIDIGGTNIRVGVIDENNNLTYVYKESTFDGVKNHEDLYIKITTLIKKVPNYEEANAIGIGFPGCIKQEEIISSNNLGILANFPLIERLNKDFNKNVYIENDARVALLAEAMIGAGKNKDTICYVTISTGLGGGAIIGNKIYHGSNNLGGYFSRMILDGKNASNSLISGTALVKEAKERISVKIQDTKEVFELAIGGDLVAKEIIDKFKKNLTVLLLNITYTINPEIIVLGGGVLNSKEYFLNDVINEFMLKSKNLERDTIITSAVLEEPGVIGAALLAKGKEEK